MDAKPVTWVKLCSIKSKGDLNVVIKACPDAAGFLVGQTHNSTDFISPDKAKELASVLPKNIKPILVTHLSKAEEIFNLVMKTGIKTIQLHGNSNIKQIIDLRNQLDNKCELIYVIHANAEFSVNDINEIIPYIDMILIDSCDLNNDRVGGTGIVHDWEISSGIVKLTNIPVILAGGLNINNLQQAIQKVKPFGVDVNSGVKDTHGYRSKKLCQEFVKIARLN